MLRREPLLFQALDLWIYGPKFLLKGKVGSCKCCQREDRATSKHLRGPKKLCLSQTSYLSKKYATAIFGPKNLRKKSVNRDKIEFATKWRKCYKMTLKRENGQLTSTKTYAICVKLTNAFTHFA